MNYVFNSIVSVQEQEALKNMIFKRAQERAQALVEEVEESYTSSTKVEIMDIARNSFVSNKNPFSIEFPAEKEPVIEEISPKEKAVELSKKNIENIKNNIYQKQTTIQSDIAEKVMTLNMAEARVGLDKKQAFVGALDFLNSQASLSLINKRQKGFEALA